MLKEFKLGDDDAVGYDAIIIENAHFPEHPIQWGRTSQLPSCRVNSRYPITYQVAKCIHRLYGVLDYLTSYISSSFNIRLQAHCPFCAGFVLYI